MSGDELSAAPPHLPATVPGPSTPQKRKRRFHRLSYSVKILALIGILYYAIVFAIPGVRKAWTELREVNPWFLIGGVGLQIGALTCYSFLTRAALGDAATRVSSARLFRIQMSTRALSSIIPGGSAAGSALGYRLMTMSGVPGQAAGFALATAGLGSAVVLNLLFWLALMISIPIRGVNAAYTSAAILGIVVMLIAGAIVFGLTEGKGRAERIVRWVASKLRLDQDKAARGVRQIGQRVEGLTADKPLLARVAGWAAANWLFDMASLWVFLRAFGEGPDVDALMVAFGLANVAAVLPIVPGGLGIIETVIPVTLIGFGMTRAQALIGTASYRLVQYWFPIVLGAILYGSLRLGPWSIGRRERLKRLRDLAAERRRESAIDFAERFERRPGAGTAPRGIPIPMPAVHDGDRQPARPRPGDAPDEVDTVGP